MTIFELLGRGIEVEMHKEEEVRSIIFRFRKGDMSFRRIMTYQQIMEFNGNQDGLEDNVCREAVQYFEGAQKEFSLLNEHGKYVVEFAHNHRISINEANEHPTVQAHLIWFNAQNK